MRARVWKSENTLASEEILGVWSELTRALKKEDIMLFGSRERVVVEVVNGDGRTVGG